MEKRGLTPLTKRDSNATMNPVSQEGSDPIFSVFLCASVVIATRQYFTTKAVKNAVSFFLSRGFEGLFL
jgi:hypothetical protein